MEKDPGHWLFRLSPDEWLAAAENELVHCEQALSRRAVRPGMTHARRAAGMALNAVLITDPNPTYGRSYMEHVVALAGDPAAPEAVRAAAQWLRDTPAAPPPLITIARPDMMGLEHARRIVDWVRAQLRANG